MGLPKGCRDVGHVPNSEYNRVRVEYPASEGQRLRVLDFPAEASKPLRFGSVLADFQHVEEALVNRIFADPVIPIRAVTGIRRGIPERIVPAVIEGAAAPARPIRAAIINAPARIEEGIAPAITVGTPTVARAAHALPQCWNLYEWRIMLSGNLDQD